MKLNFGKRLVLFFHWLFALVGCAIAVIYCVAPDIMWNVFSMIYDKIGKRQTDIIGAACLAIYVILAISSLTIILSNRQKREERSFIIVESGDAGKTRIAVGAVDQMIRQATKGIADISSMKTSIQNLGDAISIESDVVILDDAHVPTVTATIQRSVRSYIELNCGVTVREITVNVKAVEASKDPGRKARETAVAPEAPVKTAPAPEYEAPEAAQEAEPEFDKAPEAIVLVEPDEELDTVSEDEEDTEASEDISND